MRGASCSRSREELDCPVARHEVLRLQLVPGAGREVEPEVGEPLVPGSGNALLLGAVHGVVPGQGMALAVRQSSVEEPAAGPLAVRVCASLHPDLATEPRGPAGEEAHAVGAGERLVERVEQCAVAHVVEHVLAHLEGRLDRELDRGHDAERAQGHDGTVERRRCGLPRETHGVAGGGDQFQATHARAQGRVAVAGAVGARRHRAGHRDVPERRHVVDGPARGLEGGGRLPVAHAARHAGYAPVGVDLDVPRQARDADVDTGRVREVVEGVGGAEGVDAGAALDEPLELGHGGWVRHLGRRELDVTGPVTHGAVLSVRAVPSP